MHWSELVQADNSNYGTYACTMSSNTPSLLISPSDISLPLLPSFQPLHHSSISGVALVRVIFFKYVYTVTLHSLILYKAHSASTQQPVHLCCRQLVSKQHICDEGQDGDDHR